MKMCLEHTMPAIVREEAFFATLFGLKPKKDPLAKDAVHRYAVFLVEMCKSCCRIACFCCHDIALCSPSQGWNPSSPDVENGF